MAEFILRDYQQRAIDSVMREWSNGIRSTLLVMATGTGKTVVFKECIARWQALNPGKRVLVIAHRRVLIDQAKNKIGHDPDIDIITVQAASKRTEKSKEDAYGLIVIDEAHHSLAKSYRKVINHYKDANVLGVTATPERADGSDMGEVFDSVAMTYDISDGIKDGYLSQIKMCSADLSINLGNVHTYQGDYDTKELADAVEPLLESAAMWIKENAADRHTVVFLPLVDTAKKMAQACLNIGLAAEEVDGDSIGKKAILSRFESGETKVICNAALLTEGWDAPICDCVMVLRPTQSRSLYVQMVGRGTRLHEGKKDLLVPDILALNAKHDVMRPADVLLSDHNSAVETMEYATKQPSTIDELSAKRDAAESREASMARAIIDNGSPASTKQSHNNNNNNKTKPLIFRALGKVVKGTVKTLGAIASGADELTSETIAAYNRYERASRKR